MEGINCINLFINNPGKNTSLDQSMGFPRLITVSYMILLKQGYLLVHVIFNFELILLIYAMVKGYICIEYIQYLFELDTSKLL